MEIGREMGGSRHAHVRCREVHGVGREPRGASIEAGQCLKTMKLHCQSTYRRRRSADVHCSAQAHHSERAASRKRPASSGRTVARDRPYPSCLPRQGCRSPSAPANDLPSSGLDRGERERAGEGAWAPSSERGLTAQAGHGEGERPAPHVKWVSRAGRAGWRRHAHWCSRRWQPIELAVAQRAVAGPPVCATERVWWEGWAGLLARGFRGESPCAACSTLLWPPSFPGRLRGVALPRGRQRSMSQTTSLVHRRV